jgi:stress-induced morphogen
MVPKELRMVDSPSKKTSETRKIENLLLQHFPDYPEGYPPSAYRYNPGSIRVRVVSNRFSGKELGERDDLVYPILKKNLPEGTWQDITIILLLAPEELKDSLANLEFEHPVLSPR